MIEHQICSRSRSGGLELKSGYRINAFGPGHHAPGLDNPGIRYQLDVSADNVPVEYREGPTRLWVNFGGPTGERLELFGIEQCLIQALRTGLEVNLLVNA